MLKRVLSLVLVLLMLLPLPVAGAKFSYDIPVQHDQLEVTPEGVVLLTRFFEFRVLASSTDAGTEIWAGIPTPNTQIRAVTDEDGQEVSFSFNGSVVILRGFSIAPGSKSGFFIEAQIPSFLFPDSQNTGYATLQYIPGWWSAPVLEQKVAIILPEGVTRDEIRTGTREWDAVGNTEDGRQVVVWEEKDMAPNQRLSVNVGFPARYLSVNIAPPPQPSPSPVPPGSFTPPPSPRHLPGSLGGGFEGVFFLFFLGVVVLGIMGSLASREGYKAPYAAMEGVGINTDLDPVEAAVLLRLEPRKILTLALLDLLKNNHLKVEQESPLRLQKFSSMTLTGYKLCLFESVHPETGMFDENKVVACFKDLVQTVIDKTKPYCRRETEAYYRGKVSEQWERLKDTSSGEEAFARFDESLFWLLLDEQFESQLETAVPKDYQVFPHNYWLWMHFGVHDHHHWPYFGSFFRGTGHRLWPDTYRYSEVQRQLFTPIVVAPAATRQGRSGGGSGMSGPSCACACACVSCACACACAGGGGCT